MKTIFPISTLVLALLASCLAELRAAPATSSDRSQSSLKITQDAATGDVVVSWNGKGVLKEASAVNGRYKPVRKSKKQTAAGTYVTEPTDEAVLYRVESASAVFSVNIVGYVNLTLGPGLSLIANPLFYTNYTVEYWLPVAPDGAQIYKFTAGGGFEVSTFDAVEGAWTNPDLEVPPGTGFYFNNPSAQNFTQLFVGEVWQGTLVNPLPAGISTAGSLVPQAGSVNTLHNIPGDPGDEMRMIMNDGQNPPFELTAVFSAEDGWVPDLILGVGQGLWLNKQRPQNWVRVFWAN